MNSKKKTGRIQFCIASVKNNFLDFGIGAIIFLKRNSVSPISPGKKYKHDEAKLLPDLVSRIFKTEDYY